MAEKSPASVITESFTREDVERSLVEGFARVVARYPGRVALRDPRRTYTFAELERHVRAVAVAIIASGTDSTPPVALLLDHGAPTVVAILAALAAGRAYVPLDPAHPRCTLQQALRDSGADFVIASDDALALARELDTKAAILDIEQLEELEMSNDGETLADLARRTTADSLACVLYTSGSTGMPKGTVHTHRNLAHLVWSNVKTYAITAEDHLALVFSTSYAASLSEIFGAVLTGASLSMVSAKQAGMGGLADWLRRERITVLKLPVGLFRAFLRSLPAGETFPDVRLVHLGGEALYRKDVDRFQSHFRPDCRLVNRLASTESLSTTRYLIERGHSLGEGVVPVGHASDDTEVLIVDDHGQPAIAGAVGQIVVRSRYLSSGYWRQDALTAATFLPGPPGDPRSTLLTSDLGRLRPDGCLEHFGRSDQQVKVRGYRVELPAVEAALNALDDVLEAAAAAHPGTDGETKRLVGYVVARPGRRLSVAALRAALAPSLPDFMIPSSFIVLHGLPTTATGKVDRRQLPAPGSVRPLLDGVRVSPRTSIERQLSEIWAKVLDVAEVGINDNFFDLGGDSLLLLRAHASVCAVLGVELPVVALFSHPTIAALAESIADIDNAGSAPDPEGERPPASVPGEGRSIAIIGMAGIFPGARDVEEFWRNLRAGVESIRTLTEDELRGAGVETRLLDDPAFVRTVPEPLDFKRFDAELFGLHPREAACLDPQHRMLLETAWHALEDAGQAPERCAGRIGVFAGTAQSAYLQQNLLPYLDPAERPSDLELRLATDQEFLATRIAYKLNLRGPAINVSTACSTALVAVHLACRSLLDGECELAAAGAAAVESPEPTGYRYQAGWITSRDGHCRPFDAKAGGTVFGSGAGVVVLKRLDRALADRDNILAVIRGSAVNNDGAAKVGFAAPSVEGQAAVIVAAQKAAGVTGDTIDYVEAHGTGTALGDPIEIAALTQAFRASTTKAATCALGSVKANIGHLSRAAGIAGLIKTVQALRHREIPPSLHCDEPNPAIDWAGGPFFVNTTLRAWEAPADRPRRAAVSSFGVGGTNAHLILEEAPAPLLGQTSQPWQLLTMSARSEAALSESTAALADHLAQEQDGDLADVAFTLQVGRHAFAERRIAVCRDRASAIELLRASPVETRDEANRSSGTAPSIVFMFPGQGAQYVGMARGIYEAVASFRADVDRCAEALGPELDLDLRHVLFAEPDRAAEATALLARTRLTQPALFTIEWALARLFMRWGIRPDAMIGHSIGEHTAACLAGVMDVESTLLLIARRGRLMESLPAGRMLAVHLTEDEARNLCSDEISLAAVNAPRLCVLAGPVDAMATLIGRLAEQGIDHHLLRTSHAFHSKMMDGALASFTAEMARHPSGNPEIPYVSGVTGKWITPADATSPDYFSRLLRGTVRFSDGLRTLAGLDNAIFVEIGPGRSLCTLGRQHRELDNHQVFSSVRSASEGRSDREVVLRTLGGLWLHGARIDWGAVHSGEQCRRVPLPGYPFQRREHWVSRTGATSAAPRGAASPPSSRSPAQAAAHLPSQREQILAAPAAQRSSLVAGFIRKTINGLLGHDICRAVPGNIALSDFGVDSLQSIQLQARLEADLDVRLAVGSLPDQSIDVLAEEISGRMC